MLRFSKTELPVLELEARGGDTEQWLISMSIFRTAVLNVNLNKRNSKLQTFIPCLPVIQISQLIYNTLLKYVKIKCCTLKLVQDIGQKLCVRMKSGRELALLQTQVGLYGMYNIRCKGWTKYKILPQTPHTSRTTCRAGPQTPHTF